MPAHTTAKRAIHGVTEIASTEGVSPGEVSVIMAGKGRSSTEGLTPADLIIEAQKLEQRADEQQFDNAKRHLAATNIRLLALMMEQHPQIKVSWHSPGMLLVEFGKKDFVYAPGLASWRKPGKSQWHLAMNSMDFIHNTVLNQPKEGEWWVVRWAEEVEVMQVFKGLGDAPVLLRVGSTVPLDFEEVDFIRNVRTDI